jgi:hypothetical protein
VRSDFDALQVRYILDGFNFGCFCLFGSKIGDENVVVSAAGCNCVLHFRLQMEGSSVVASNGFFFPCGCV